MPIVFVKISLTKLFVSGIPLPFNVQDIFPFVSNTYKWVS